MAQRDLEDTIREAYFPESITQVHHVMGEVIPGLTGRPPQAAQLLCLPNTWTGEWFISPPRSTQARLGRHLLRLELGDGEAAIIVTAFAQAKLPFAVVHPAPHPCVNSELTAKILQDGRAVDLPAVATRNLPGEAQAVYLDLDYLYAQRHRLKGLQQASLPLFVQRVEQPSLGASPGR